MYAHIKTVNVNLYNVLHLLQKINVHKQQVDVTGVHKFKMVHL